MLFLLILCCATAFVATAMLVRYAREHAGRYGTEVPQRFHTGDVPRLGGVAMLMACTVGWVWMVLSDRFRLPNQIRIDLLAAVSLWLATAIPVVGGIAEDLTQRLPARYRLLLTVCAAVLAVGMLDLWVPRLGWAPLDAWWAATPWLGVALAVVAISGLPHAFNLIDGYNGLAGLVALICSFAVAYVALQVGDRQLAGMVLALAGGTAGFLLWNYPRGLIFAGDGGAYLWGVVIAVATVQLVMRYPQVSPWFPVLLLIYPVWETLFSIWRKLVRGQSPGVADALHFHQLIYRRIVREVFHDDEARRMLMRNNRTSPYLWGFTLLTVVPAVLFWHNTAVLVAFTALFVVSYVWVYVSIVRFRSPRWLKLRQ
ncbi:MAG: glycosyltransferase family 4 protein [Burkholderiales bacterium]|nr:glycosyltransferase family 4 protein [Burkholderiales bacterium]